MNDESSTPHGKEYYEDLAARLPKVPPEDWTRSEMELGSTQFGNNFYLLFKGRLDEEQSGAPDSYKQHHSTFASYLERMRSTYGEQWQVFVKENDVLLSQLTIALDDEIIYKGLLKHYNKYPEVDAIGIFVWRQLNPLLEQAAEGMRKVGINPEEFFR